MADMRATKEWAELEKILAEFERLELGSEAMGLATNFANQVGWLGPGPCHGMACLMIACRYIYTIPRDRIRSYVYDIVHCNYLKVLIISIRSHAWDRNV